MQALGASVAAVVAAVIRAPIATAAAVLVLAAGSLYLVIVKDRLAIDTNTAEMISAELDWRQDFDAYREGFPMRDRNIVAVVEGPSSAASLRYARALAAALRAERERYPAVLLEGEGEFFERNGLLYLPLSELDALYERLVTAQPFLGRLARDVSGAGIVEVLGDAIELAGDETASIEARDEIFAAVSSTLRAAAAGERRPVLWEGLLGGVTDDSARQLILIRPAVDETSLASKREAIERIYEIGAGLDAELARDVDLSLTGALVMEHEELSTIAASAATAGIASLAMVIVVLLITLRSLRLLGIAIVTLFAGLALTAAFAGVSVGRLNLLSVAFAVLYVGLGVDFILHMLLRLKELQRKGMVRDLALEQTARGVGGSLVICAVTTAVGFFAFIPTDFIGISELGLISGSGMLISLIVTLTLLPALLRLFWRESLVDDGRRRRPSPPLPQLPPRAVCAAALLLALAACLLVPSLSFDGNPIRLRDPDSESIRTLEALAADSEAPLFDLVVLVPDGETAAATAEALAGLDSVEQVRTAASLAPDDQQEKLLVLDDLKFFLGETLRRFEPSRGGEQRIGAALERLAALVESAPAPSAAERALGAAARDWLARGAASNSADRAAALDADLLGDLVAQVRRLEHSLDASAFTLNELPAELRERWINPAGQQLVEVVPREDLSAEGAAARFVDEVRSVAPNATGLPVVYEEAAATVTRAFVTALLYAFVAVSLLLLLFMRSVRDMLLVLAPIAFAALLTAALSVLLGLPLNFANVIALPLLVGVGVDSGIHMVHRARTEPPAARSLLETSTSRAIFASAITTVASFGNLAFSAHPGMASMGQLLTLGMAMSLIAVLIVLPALMRLGRAA